MAENGGADVLLSIHLNEYRDRAQSGPQVFYQKGGTDGQRLAGHLQQAMITVLKPEKQRRAMAGDYFVLRGKLPSALVECGFLSNPTEAELLTSEDYQNRLVWAIHMGVLEFLNKTTNDLPVNQ